MELTYLIGDFNLQIERHRFMQILTIMRMYRCNIFRLWKLKVDPVR